MTYKNDILLFLRWFGIVPLAIVAYVLVFNFIELLCIMAFFQGKSEGTLYHLIIIPILTAGIAGYAFVFFGVLIAPARKKWTALALIILLTILTALSLSLDPREAGISGVIEFIASMIGGIVGYIFENKNNRL